MRTSTILIVDDYERFRQVMRSILEQRGNLEVIGEASDGLEAVQKAKELQPELILLDVALPKSSGIQAAKRLRDLVPRAKILFVSIENSSDIVREALNAGGVGYIHKLHIASDLLPGTEAVLRGERFVSSSLAPFVLNESHDEHHRTRDAALSPHASFIHEVAFYADDAAFSRGFTEFIERNLSSGNVVIMAVTESHRTSIVRNLQRDGVDIGACSQRGSYVLLDAGDTLSKFMINDWPDSARLARVLKELIERAPKSLQEKQSRVAVCGELAPTLLVEGKTWAAIEVEHLWDEITRTLGIDTLCGYLSSSFHGSTEAQAFESICAEHTASSFR
jgi:DNA-binding NarL/FixJ family response regulator